VSERKEVQIQGRVNVRDFQRHIMHAVCFAHNVVVSGDGTRLILTDESLDLPEFARRIVVLLDGQLEAIDALQRDLSTVDYVG